MDDDARKQDLISRPCVKSLYHECFIWKLAYISLSEVTLKIFLERSEDFPKTKNTFAQNLEF